jgi:hypothetical protein
MPTVSVGWFSIRFNFLNRDLNSRRPQPKQRIIVFPYFSLTNSPHIWNAIGVGRNETNFRGSEVNLEGRSPSHARIQTPSLPETEMISFSNSVSEKDRAPLDLLSKSELANAKI